MLLILLVLAFVAPAIFPGVNPLAMHDPALELADEMSTVDPLKSAFA